MSTVDEDAPTRERVYYDPEDYAEPRDVADPASASDPTALGIWERVAGSGASAGLAAVTLLLGTVVVGLLVYYLTPVFSGLINNTYVQATAGALTLLVLGLVAGGKRKTAELEGQDKLIVDYGGDRPPEPYRGEYDVVGENLIFRPFKGQSGLLFKTWNHYTVADLSRNPDAPDANAEILLPKQRFARAVGDYGTVGAVRAAAIEPNPHGDPGNLKLTLPIDGDQEVLQDAERQLRELRAEYDHIQERLASEERRRGQAKAQADETLQDQVERLMDLATIVLVASQGGSLSQDQIEDLTSDGVSDTLLELDEKYAQDNDR